MVVSQFFETADVGTYRRKVPRKRLHLSACAIKLSTNKCVRVLVTFPEFFTAVINLPDATFGHKLNSTFGNEFNSNS